tara:strand:+ start:1942 stop:3864 length:1923 start_codon:yes stop_codon:yes gene_type:complete
MSTRKIDFSVLNTSPYELPQFEEKRGAKWITYGADDQYATYLEELYYTSSIHNAIINGVTDMIRGDGPYSDEWDRNDASKEAWLRLNDLFGEEITYKTALDLKLYGQFYWCVIWNQARTKIAKVEHVPVRSIRSGLLNEEGKVDTFYYCYDWSDKSEKHQAYKAFSLTDRTSPKTIMQVKRHAPSFEFYGLPDYIGSTNYIELDRQISSFHLNSIKSGMFPGWHIGFKNGVPTDEEREAIERKIKQKFTGPEAASKLILTFNDGPDQAPDFTPLQSNSNADMFQYLSDELSNKILSGHRVTSPLLFGVKGDGTGFGNNADELRDSYSLFYTTVIQGYQRLITNAVETILSVSEQPLKVTIPATAPADFIDLAGGKGSQAYNGIQISAAKDLITAVSAGELTREAAITMLVQMLQFPKEIAEAMFSPQESAIEELSSNKCSDKCNHFELSSEIADALIEMGEDPPEGYVLIDEREVDYDLESVHDALWAFSTTPNASSEEDSEDDTPLIKVRYAYAGQITDKSREFCRKMIAANKVYRREDIDRDLDVNPGFGPNGGRTYNCFRFKGGPNCHHYFQRQTYLKENNEKISVNQAQRIIRALPVDERAANRLPNVGGLPGKDKTGKPSVLPIDMPNRGYLNPQ